MPVRISPETSDSSLIEQMRRGDETALALAYDRYGTLVYSVAYHILGEAPDAEEVTADVFMQAWTSAGTFDPMRANMAAWLTVIARSRALDRVRARKRKGRIVEALTQAGDTPAMTPPDASAEAIDLRTQVMRCLAELPADQRRALELAYYGGLSQSEIAEMLDEPLGTIKTRIRTAMIKLRSALEAYY